MVKTLKYSELKPGKKYKLGDVHVGKFKSQTNSDTLIFLDSEFGEKGENEIDAIEEDNFTEIKPKKSRRKGGKKQKRQKTKRNGVKN